MKNTLQYEVYFKHNSKRIIVVLAIFIIILAGCSNSKTNVESNTTESLNDGITIFNGNKDYALKYIAQEEKTLDEIVGNKNHEQVYVISQSGKVENTADNIILNLDGSVTSSDKDKIYKNLAGIYLTNNFHSITDAYYDSKKYLENNEKVMVVLLDGFSLNQFEVAREKGYVDFLKQYFRHEALSVVTPVTNAGYAAIITGKTPDINGVHDRSVREMNVESIFDYALKNNKKSILFEGDIKILNTEIEPGLHIDENKDGDTDDEMFECALKASAENYDFVFIHFHGIDDRGHSYGPMAEETMSYIKLVDNYISELSNIWNGPIILTADHGMHETESGGDHVECRSSDMVVPYFVKD